MALAGSVSSEKAARMRELVSEARKAGPLKSTIGSDGAHLGQSPGGELPVERRATSGPVVSLEERERVLVVVREYVADVRRSMEELLPGVETLTEEHAELWKRVEALEVRVSNTGEGEEARGACGSGAFQPHLSRTEAASASAGDAREKVSATHTPPSPAPSVPFGKYEMRPAVPVEFVAQPDGAHRVAPATGEVPARIETGVVQIDEDWPGVFIRGDHAQVWGRQLLQFIGSRSKLDIEQLHGLAALLTSCDARNAKGAVQIASRAPAATGVDVRRLLRDYRHMEIPGLPLPSEEERLTYWLHAQNVRTVTP